MNKKIQLFASCIPVKGAYQSVICDLQRNFIYPIPDVLYQIIERYHGCDIDEIKSNYNEDHHEIIDDYFRALEEKELIFFTSHPSLFPKLSMEWDEPFIITNAIVDIIKDTEKCEKFIEQLLYIGCHTLQIRIFDFITIEALVDVLQKVGNGRISSIELLLKYDDIYTIDKLKEICNKFLRISIITFYSSPEQKIYHFRENEFGNVFFITEKIGSEKCCGQVMPNFFTINIKTFTESKMFNSCLNRKVSLDKEGNIKNCPSMIESFGNIEDTSLLEVIDKSSFKAKWGITKDEIQVCKDCEFRYVCTDCRAYLENPNEILSKPLKCGYNPYTGEWNEWSSNPLKQKIIDFYGMRKILN